MKASKGQPDLGLEQDADVADILSGLRAAGQALPGGNVAYLQQECFPRYQILGPYRQQPLDQHLPARAYDLHRLAGFEPYSEAIWGINKYLTYTTGSTDSQEGRCLVGDEQISYAAAHALSNIWFLLTA